jgi:hypothetical protein
MLKHRQQYGKAALLLSNRLAQVGSQAWRSKKYRADF